MNDTYTPLHVHSDASLLDGLSKTARIAERIKDIGVTGCALTDHGSISNCVSFLKEMKKADKKPVLGCELYICDDHASIKSKENRSLAHLPVLAKNTIGWNNLMIAVSDSNNPDHYYHRPRLSLAQLSKYLDGNIIGFSGHLGSHVSNAIEQYGFEGGLRTARILEKIFGKGNFWLECQLMDQKVTPKQLEIVEVVRRISAETEIPCIATPDAHYAYKEDAILQRILLCSNMGVNFEKGRDPNFGMNTFFLSDCFHIPTHEEMVGYGHTPEELENTNVILSQIEEYEILKPPMLKQFDCPKDMTPDDYLRDLCRGGWRKLIIPKVEKSKHEEYKNRVEEELGILQGAGLSSYFLIVQDIVKYVEDQGWLPGPGRGSAAGCLVSYLIGITKLDPIKHDLLFSRFYNAGRNTGDHIAMPDIDIDVPIHVRADITEYIKQKYGTENVSQMITYQTMKGARALKEVFRAYGDVSFEDINQITKNIVDEAKIADQLQEMDDPSIIRWCLENKPKDFAVWCSLDKEGNLTGPYADRFDQAIRLEGTKCAQSKHAAGIIIAPTELSKLCPMIYDSKTKLQVAGMEMDDLESIGLMKLDLLGVAAFSKLMYVQELNPNFNPDPLKMDFTDQDTWDLLSSGRTKGVFQLESRMGQSFAKKLKPENIDHLAALGALLRPGSLQTVEENGKSVTENYIAIKNKELDPSYLDDELRPILQSTFSKMIYQEQAMKIAVKFAGFSEEESDTYIRKGIGKKKPELIAIAKKMFIEGCEKLDTLNEKNTLTTFNGIEKSQRYSFNASHSYSYMYTAFITAYAKVHYPKEFFTAYLKYAHDKLKPQKEIYELVNDAKNMDIFIMPPNIVHMNNEFELIDGNIYFGLCDVKNVGKSVVEKLKLSFAEIDEGHLSKELKDWSWIEFLIYLAPVIKINSLESLINVGGCDCFGLSRTEMLFQTNIAKEFSDREVKWIKENFDKKNSLENILVTMQKCPPGRKGACANKNRVAKMEGLINTILNPPYSLEDKPHQISQMEYELLGVNITASKLDECKTRYKANCSCLEYNKGYGASGKVIIAAGIESVRQIKTKKGKNPGQEMAFIEASDETGTIDSAVVFPDYWAEYKNMIVEGNRLLLCGQRNQDKTSFIVELVEQL